MKKVPGKITVCSLEVIVMPTGEIICAGETVGWFDRLGKYLTPRPGKKAPR